MRSLEQNYKWQNHPVLLSSLAVKENRAKFIVYLKWRKMWAEKNNAPCKTKLEAAASFEEAI